MPTTPRELADQFLDELVGLDPILATSLGLPDGADRFPDFSPAGHDMVAELQRRTLAELDAAERADLDPIERRCARLLRERLTASLALHDTGEGVRSVSSLFCPVQAVRGTFLQMPTATEADWRTVAARLSRVGEAYAGYRASLAEGIGRGLLAGPAQVDAVLGQLDAWAADGGWFGGFVAAGPDGVLPALSTAAASADAAVAELRAWLATEYAPAAAAQPDPVGRQRYALHARYWTGSDLDLDEAYAWGWTEFARIDAELRAGAERVLPGSTPLEAMRHLNQHGPAIDGVEPVRKHLQGLMDAAIEALDGVHFELAPPVRAVQAMIAPAGTAAAPYYTRPSLDFARPGRTWLPTLGQTRFPIWDLVSTWYHEGVPGHHLQLAQWVYVAPHLSRYQIAAGAVGANLEGWALYAERLMDELGFLTDPAARIGYLDAQQMRAVRVIVDIGMHLGLEIPRQQGTGQAFHPGERWTPALAREFFGLNSGRPAEFLDSELVRYLGMPGQAISYKLGERAWLAGRSAAQAARAARGEVFDAKAWHMAALSQGSLGLDDLAAELALL